MPAVLHNPDSVLRELLPVSKFHAGILHAEAALTQCDNAHKARFK